MRLPRCKRHSTKKGNNENLPEYPSINPTSHKRKKRKYADNPPHRSHPININIIPQRPPFLATFFPLLAPIPAMSFFE